MTRRFLIPSMLFAALGHVSPLVAEPSTQVSLVDQRHLPGWHGAPVGNLVLKSHGKKERLTTTATAQQPKVSKAGIIGWVDCSEEGNLGVLHVAQGVPIGSRLILRHPDGFLLTLPATCPIIEEWNFDTEGSHVIMKSRGLHGPAVIERFTLSGMQDGTCNAYGEKAPKWALPYLVR
jgi:hypothetical protein